jgi:hypothetical protein
VKQQVHPVLQGPFLFDYVRWGVKDMGAPPIMEPRSYCSIYRFLRRYATNDAEVRMVFLIRAGLMSFHLGDEVQEVPIPGK